MRNRQRFVLAALVLYSALSMLGGKPAESCITAVSHKTLFDVRIPGAAPIQAREGDMIRIVLSHSLRDGIQTRALQHDELVLQLVAETPMADPHAADTVGSDLYFRATGTGPTEIRIKLLDAAGNVVREIVQPVEVTFAVTPRCLPPTESANRP